MGSRERLLASLERLEPRLLLSTTPLSELFQAAEIIDVTPAGSVSVNGEVVSDGQTQMYQFSTPATGSFFIDMEALGGNLDSVLEVYNERHRRFRRNDNASRGTLDSKIRMRVRPGQTYYVRAGSKTGTAGSYELTLTSDPRDDHGNTFDAARRLRVNRRGRGRGRGSINYYGDVDMLRLVAPMTGEMSVSLYAAGRRSYLDTEAFIYDSDGQQIAHDDDNGIGLNSLVTFDVVAGETYYIKAGAFNNGSVGRYSLKIETTERIDPPPNPDPDPDPELDPEPEPEPESLPGDPQPGSVITAEVLSVSGGLQLRVLGTNASDTITLSQSVNAFTLTTSSGSEEFVGSFASVMVYGFGGDDVIRLTNSVSAEGWIYAGSGNDTIYDAGGASALYGGMGDDLLISVGGQSDTLHGEGGFDSFWLDSTDAVADASSQELSAKTVHSIGEFYQPYSTDPGSEQYVSMEIAGQDFTDPTPTGYAAGWANFADTPLFVDGPQYDDINQGAVGDCYLLAALAGLADTDPVIVRQMITALGDGTYAMRFYDQGNEVYLRLDADLPVNSSGGLVYAKAGPDGESWVALAEKAYAYYRYGQNTYASLSGGWMSTVFRQITGGYTDTRSTNRPAVEMYNYFADHLSAGRSVTLGTNYDAVSPIVGNHAYTVMSVQLQGGQRTVTIYNPWGWDGRTWDSNRYDGLLTVTMDQIQDNFSASVVSLV